MIFRTVIPLYPPNSPQASASRYSPSEAFLKLFLFFSLFIQYLVSATRVFAQGSPTTNPDDIQANTENEVWCF